MAGQGRIGDAIAFVHEAIPENFEKARAMNDLAIFLAPRLNHVAEAIELLQEASPWPPVTPGLRNLAWIYATCPDRRFRNGPKAVELARRACELSEWKNAQCRQTLADAYLEAGDLDHAIEELRAVLQLNPQDRSGGQAIGVDQAATSVRRCGALTRMIFGVTPTRMPSEDWGKSCPCLQLSGWYGPYANCCTNTPLACPCGVTFKLMNRLPAGVELSRTTWIGHSASGVS